MKWILVLILAGLLLGGCGGSAASGATVEGGSSLPGAAATPEQVHGAWVEAMKANNRDALLDLAADMEFRTAFVDDNLRSLQDGLRGTTDGKLQTVDIRAPTDDSAGKLGVSVWRFEKRPVCYGTFMVLSNGIWKVTRWGLVPEQCKGVS